MNIDTCLALMLATVRSVMLLLDSGMERVDV